MGTELGAPAPKTVYQTQPAAHGSGRGSGWAEGEGGLGLEVRVRRFRCGVKVGRFQEYAQVGWRLGDGRFRVGCEEKRFMVRGG